MAKSAKRITEAAQFKNHFMFTNPQGLGWVGGKVVKRADGSIIVVNPRPVKFGLQEGSGDLIGWDTITITADMVGKKVAVFQSIEIKTVNDRLSKAQRIWNKVVRKAGGIAQVWKENRAGDIIILQGEEIE